MVAEAVQETPAVTEVAEQAPPPEQTQETPPQEQEPVADDELIADLREQGFLSSESGEGAAAQTEAGSPDVTKLTPEQALEEGARREREATARKTSAENRAREEQGIRQALQNRKANITQQLAAAGVDPNTVLWVAQQFDEHHGQVLQANRYDLEAAGTASAQAIVNAVYPAAIKALGAQGAKFQEEGLHPSWDAYVESIVKHAREGMLTQKQADKQADEKVLKYAAKLKAQGALPQGRSSAAPSGSPRGGGPAIHSQAENDRAFNQGLISREQYAANDERFRGEGN